jgi:hypothetical protein
VLLRRFLEADLERANENLTFHLSYFNRFIALFTVYVGTRECSLIIWRRVVVVWATCMWSRNASYSFRSLRTSRRSLMAVWTSSSSSSKMRLQDRLAALKPFLSIRRSFFNDVVNEMRSFSNS